MATTPNRLYPLVNNGSATGGVSFAADVAVLLAAFGMIDADIQSVINLLSGKAALASPDFTGSPTAPTQPTGDDSNKLATTAFVKAANALALANLVGAAPAALDTVYEIAAKLLEEEGALDALMTVVGEKVNAADVYLKAAIDAMLADMATKSGAETLINKTLTTPALILEHSAGFSQTGLGRMGFDETAVGIRVGDGSSSRLITPDDATGKWELIRKIVFAGDITVNMNNLAAFDEIEVDGWIMTNAADRLSFRVSSDNGLNWYSSAGNYYGTVDGVSGGAGYTSSSTTIGTAEISWDNNRAGSYPMRINTRIEAFNKAAASPYGGDANGTNSVPADISYHVGGRINPAVAWNALQLIAAAGNGISSGIVHVRGRRG